MLVNQHDEEAINNLPSHYSWIKKLIAQIGTRFAEPAGHKDGFPCVFAQKVHSLQNIKFLLVGFCPFTKKYDLAGLFAGLQSYLQECQSWDGNISTAQPLLAVFEPVAGINSTQDYEEIFLASLQYLIDHDEMPWQGNLPANPEQEFWTMCFNGTQIFINVSHPNHVNRRSRNLCDALVFVINPRERFDKVAGNDNKGNLIREKIRANIDVYDHISRSMYLGHYQNGELEWPQYMLPDDNHSPPLKCPLAFS